MDEQHITSEHFTPRKTDILELQVNLDRYAWALNFCEGKTVLDLGCGAGMGTYFYSLVADKVIAVDYDKHAIEEASKWPFPKQNVEFIHGDITDPDFLQKLPHTDVCVALEILEHVEEPAGVLREMKTDHLVFSVPLHSLEISSWHKYKIDTERDVRALVGPFFDCKYYEQRHPKTNAVWIRGEGVKYRT